MHKMNNKLSLGRNWKR